MIVFCLVNTYDKLKLHEIHLRSIARAAPLCYAYDMHLALLDFNFWKKEDEMVEAVKEYTTIGEHGKYIVELLDEGEVHLIDKIPAHFGEVIATTSKPDEPKKITFPDLPDILKSSATFLIGLGRRGLPRDIMKKAKYHFDATGKGISMETCTAMGVIATQIWVARMHRQKR
jgi:hypothetical protein